MAACCDAVNCVRVSNRQMDIQGEYQLHISGCVVHFYTNFILCKSHFKQGFSNTVNRSVTLVKHE